jgi:hypothetical protein
MSPNEMTAAVKAKASALPAQPLSAEQGLSLVKPESEVRLLSPEEFSAWDSLVDASPQGSCFSRSWWLKAVGGDVRLIGCFRRGQLVAGIPLYFEKRFGVDLCTMPKLTQTLGPILPTLPDTPVAASYEQMELLAMLAKELAQHRFVFQAFHPSLQNWLPFYWNGFTQTTRFTQVVDLQPGPNALLQSMNRTARRAIRGAERAGIRIRQCEPEVLWHVEQKTFSRQNMSVPHSPEYLRGLYSAAREHGSGDCFAAFDDQGRVHSACFMIWDDKRAYGLAMGTDPEYRESGANLLLVWHTIQFAAERSRVLDFCGSVLPPIEMFWRKFGTVHVPYNWVLKMPLPIYSYLRFRKKI